MIKFEELIDAKFKSLLQVITHLICPSERTTTNDLFCHYCWHEISNKVVRTNGHLSSDKAATFGKPLSKGKRSFVASLIAEVAEVFWQLYLTKPIDSKEGLADNGKIFISNQDYSN